MWRTNDRKLTKEQLDKQTFIHIKKDMECGRVMKEKKLSKEKILEPKTAQKVFIEAALKELNKLFNAKNGTVITFPEKEDIEVKLPKKLFKRIIEIEKEKERDK